jgi:hypothetical protein
MGSASVTKRFDAISRGWVRRKKPTTRRAFGLSEPLQRGHHHLRGIPGTLEDIDTMKVCGVLFVAAVGPRNQATGDRRQRGAAGNDLIEDDDADVQPRAQRLRLGHVAEIVVRQLEHRRTLELPVTAEKTWIEAMIVFTNGENAVIK